MKGGQCPWEAARSAMWRAREKPQQQPPLASLPDLPPRGSTLSLRRSARLSKAGACSAGSLREIASNILFTLIAVLADVSKKMPSISRAKDSASSRLTSCAQEKTRQEERQRGVASHGQACLQHANNLCRRGDRSRQSGRTRELAQSTHPAIFLVNFVAAHGDGDVLRAQRLQLLDPVLQRHKAARLRALRERRG